MTDPLTERIQGALAPAPAASQRSCHATIP